MTENKRFEAYLDNNYMDDWKVQDNLTLDIYPCVSQKVAEAFTELLNGLYCTDLKLLKSNDFLLKENEQCKKDNLALLKQNEKLKRENELLSDELEQCKAVINKKWSEYLKKKELI